MPDGEGLSYSDDDESRIAQLQGLTDQELIIACKVEASAEELVKRRLDPYQTAIMGEIARRLADREGSI